MIVQAYNNPTNINSGQKNIFTNTNEYLHNAGIVQLDVMLRKIKTKLNNTLNNIINDDEILIDYTLDTI